jgi:hypothetical protein
MCYDYHGKRLIFFTDAQYGKGSVAPIENISNDNTKAYSVNPNMEYFLKVKTDGYILAPKSENFQIHNINSGTNMTDCINEICNFINTVVQKKPSIKIWIGTPEINSNNALYDSNSSLYNTFLSTLIKYSNSLYNTLSQTIWSNNIQGLYFNQESIYSQSFDADNLSKNPEFLLINAFSYYVHNSMPDKLGGDTTTEFKKDLIWAPYLPILPDTDANNTFEATLFKRIGKIITSSTCFDCAFIQAHLMTLYSNQYGSDNYDYIKCVKNGKITSELQYLKNKGIQNISTLCHSMESGHLLYRNDVSTVTESEISNYSKLERKCILGVEYEINGDEEFGDLILYTSEYSLFTSYSDYDDFVEDYPMLFYWQGEYLIPEVCDAIERKYNQDEVGEISNTPVSTNADNYLSALRHTYYPKIIDNLYSALLTPYNTAATIDLSSSDYTSGSIPYINRTLSSLFTSEHPEVYWVDSLDATPVKYDEDNYITRLTVLANSQFDLDTEKSNYSSFKTQLNSLVNSLSANVASDSDSTTNLFIKAHDWLVSNVTYVETSTNHYHSCAYGAIMPSIRKATSKGFSAALTLLCKNLGVPCLTVSGIKNGLSHHWNYVKLNNEWRFVDVSLNTPSSSDSYKYKYFLRKMPDSYAESYVLPKAKVSSDTFIKFGDVTQDGKITFADVSTLQQYISDNDSVSITPIGLIAADVDGNGIITANDLSNIASKVSDNSFVFPVETKLDNYN